METLFAHTKEGVLPNEGWQSLDDHLQSVANNMYEYAKSFSSEEIAYNIGLLHDIGKSNPEFQRYLYCSNGLEYNGVFSKEKSPHSIYGVLSHLCNFKSRDSKFISKTLDSIIRGHHTELSFVYSCADDINKLNNKNKVIKYFEDSVSKLLKNEVSFPKYIKPDNFHLWVRFLFSCLIDSDRVDTEYFCNSWVGSVRKESFISLLEMKDKYDSYISNFKQNSADSEVNRIRNRVYDLCIKNSEEKPGLFALSVPTGGGKTLSSLAFAINHAIKYDKKRIIYVIPYTSITEQTADQFCKIFGSKNVVEHHSNFEHNINNNGVSRLKIELAFENWDAPLIVTTAVQFFESLYNNNTSKCRKIHNISNSVVILDESQLLPVHLLEPCIDVINELTTNYNVSVVLCTATQMRTDKLKDVVEIVPESEGLSHKLKRTDIVFPEKGKKYGWAELADRLGEHKQVLCIVNTKRSCLDLYSCMNKNAIHLSGSMCGVHKSNVINKIKNDLKEGKEVRVISTQLVEAGVDFDFPVVFRAMTGLDSIVQAAGRCNREGRRGIEKVFVFLPEHEKLLGSLELQRQTTMEMLSCGKIDIEGNSFNDYFRLFHSKISDKGEDVLDLLKLTPAFSMQMKEASDKFKVINKNMIDIIVPYGDVDSIIGSVKKEGLNKQNSRKLQRYSVSVYPNKFRDLRDKGKIDQICDGVIMLNDSRYYDINLGITTNVDDEIFIV